MDTPTAFAILALASLIHASFQLSVSMLTLLSGHAISTKKSIARLTRLTGSFVLGAIVMTTLIVSFLSYVLSTLYGHFAPPVIWAIVSGLMIGVGVAVWVFYYRRAHGTSLWLPRGIARFMTDRTKSTKSSAEAFSLGLTSVIAELIFIIAPALAAACALITLPTDLQLAGTALYTLIASSPLVIVYILVGGGHKLSRIQKWRETNKRFLQFAAGSALFILGFYIYVNEVVATSVALRGGL